MGRISNSLDIGENGKEDWRLKKGKSEDRSGAMPEQRLHGFSETANVLPFFLKKNRPKAVF